jgi:hypothetical protein
MRLKSIAYHRNGCQGDGFYVMTFKTKIGKSEHHMMATVFVNEDDNGEYTINDGKMAVIDLDMAAKDNLTFGENSWRFEDFDVRVLDWVRCYSETQRQFA